MNYNDFSGFSFKGVHSSDLNLYKVSDGSRYKTSLLPSINNDTIEIPGRTGILYFGESRKEQIFNISLAYDAMTERQLKNFQNLFRDDSLGELIFDEYPYKKYWVKAQSTPTLDFICFDEPFEGRKQRIYKGEGSLELICFDGFGHSVAKTVEQIPSYTNESQWVEVSGLLSTVEYQNYDKFELLGETINSKIYNPGDLPADFVLSISLPSGMTEVPGMAITLSNASTSLLEQLKLRPIKIKTSTVGGDDEIQFNSQTHLIEGFKQGKRTGNVYNEYIVEGSFFQLPVSMGMEENILKINLDKSINGFENLVKIQYDYLYL